eukprot:EG_transcript_19333
MSRKQNRKGKAKPQPEGRPFSEASSRPPPPPAYTNDALDMPLEEDSYPLEYADMPRNLPFDCGEGLTLLKERWSEAFESDDLETVPISASNADPKGKPAPRLDVAREMQRLLDRSKAAKGDALEG